MGRVRFVRRALALVLMLLLVVSLNAGCTKNDNVSIQTASDWVYQGRVGDIDSFDPYGSTSSVCDWFTNMTFDTLIYNNSDTQEIEPVLAKSWETNEDNTEWTFYLQEGVTFHNGDKFTAEDIKFTYEYAANLNGEANVVKPFAAGTYAEAEVLDEYTIVFHLHQAMPDFPTYMEMKVYSKNAIETLGHAKGSVIGTGPYYYDEKETVSGQVFVATRYENYWGGTDKYKINHIATKVFGDTNSVIVAMQTGEIDYAVITAENYQILSAEPNIEVDMHQGCASFYLGYNYDTPNCDMNDVSVRRAIAQCIDKEAIVEMALEGFADVSMNFCPPSGLGYSDKVKTVEYNPEAGAKVLKEKGVDQLTIVCTVTCLRHAEIVQACLIEAGIDAKVREIDRTNWTAFKAARQDYDLFLDNCSYRGALLYNYNRFLYRGGSSNVFGFASGEYERLQDNVLLQSTWEDMLSEFEVLQQWVADNIPLFPLIYNRMFVARKSSLKGGYLGGSDNVSNWSTLYWEE